MDAVKVPALISTTTDERHAGILVRTFSRFFCAVIAELSFFDELLEISD